MSGPGELKQRHGEPSIHQRCFNGEIEAVQNFINDHHNKLSEKDEDGRTLLHWACSGSHASLVKLLMDAKIDRNIQDESGMNELMVAASVGNLNICKMLISEVKDCVNAQGRSSLFYCCSKGYFDILKLLVENGSDVNHQDKQGQTCLYRACVKGNMAIVKYLVEIGCHVNHLDMQNDSPLHIAIEADQVFYINKGEVAKYLIENDADVTAKNKSGKTPMQMTANQAVLTYLK